MTGFGSLALPPTFRKDWIQCSCCLCLGNLDGLDPRFALGPAGDASASPLLPSLSPAPSVCSCRASVQTGIPHAPTGPSQGRLRGGISSFPRGASLPTAKGFRALVEQAALFWSHREVRAGYRVVLTPPCCICRGSGTQGEVRI